MRSLLASTATLMMITPTFAGQNILEWQDNSNNESKFEIARKTESCSHNTRPWWVIAGVGAGVNTYRNTGLLTGYAYCYRVRARNANGVSAWSNEAEGIAKPDQVCTLVKTVQGTNVTYTWVCQ